MSSYFDAVESEVREIVRNTKDRPFEETFEQVAAVEAKVCDEVSLVVGDREFPQDLRELIIGQMAVFSLNWHWPENLPPKTQGRLWLQMVGDSKLLRVLHSSF